MFVGRHLASFKSVAQDEKGIIPVATLSIALCVLHICMPASDVVPEVVILSSALQTSTNTPLPMKMYTSASEPLIGSH